ncbi:response regulator, partial [candidate division KSB3 bacterium]|nr:response regulator [candidate division KSB3 bacterium]MBD3326245.1 response regulator [candidate division KSB3 bacterium]
MDKPNVVVIAQDTDTQNTLKTMLVDDYDYIGAFNGMNGIAISQMVRPTVVFVDLHATPAEAVGICKALSSSETGPSIPVVVVAESPNVDGELTSLANFGGVLQIPLQADAVKAKLQWAQETSSTQTSAAGPSPGATRDEPIRVLSVDDSSVVRKLVTMILTAEGFKVTTASDGLDGINKAKELKPDVILLDFVMPKMNGFQVCRILQKDDQLRQIPVILVTSKGDKVGDKFVNQLGVTSYITKPFQPEELVSKIHQTLDAQKAEAPAQAPQVAAPVAVAAPAQAPAEAQAPTPAAPPAAASAPAAAPSTESIQQLVQEEVARVIEENVRAMVKT